MFFRQRLLCHLLHLANSDPPAVRRQDFYALKGRLLERHGRCVGHQQQVIVDECWGSEDAGCPGRGCRRCGGDGVYRIRRYLLEVWEWRGRQFHRPAPDSVPFAKAPDLLPEVVRGRIEHRYYGRASGEARLWLYMLSGEWRLLWRDLSTHWYCSPGIWPLLRLQKMVSIASLKLSRRRCNGCDRKFFTGGSGWLYCRRCREVPPLDGLAEEIPF